MPAVQFTVVFFISQKTRNYLTKTYSLKMPRIELEQRTHSGNEVVGETKVIMMIFSVSSDACFIYPKDTVNNWIQVGQTAQFFVAYRCKNINLLEVINCGFEGEAHRVRKNRILRSVVLTPFEETTRVSRDYTGSMLSIEVMRLKIKDHNKYFSCSMTYGGQTFHSGKFHLRIYGKYYVWLMGLCRLTSGENSLPEVSFLFFI